MSNSKLERLNNKFTTHFDGVDHARELAIKQGRDILKRSTAIIRKLHGQGLGDVTRKSAIKEARLADLNVLMQELMEIEKQYKDLKRKLNKYPELFYSNMVENFIQEYVEATIMLILLNNDLSIDKIPDPDKMGVRYSTYLLGLSDVIGELRRCTLDSIRDQRLIEAGRYLEAMEEIFDILINLNYPDGVLPLRRKQDIARSLIEKTRGELAFAVSEYSLNENISELRNELSKYNNKLERKN